jgi:isopentenyl-diphosphate delta-isomerase
MTADQAVSSADVEQVVLLDEVGRAVGTAAKQSVHHADTPLHLAFSCYVFDDAGRLLLTQRAATKLTWPGAWTNTVCGHPSPGEDVVAAVRRRARQELGLGVRDLRIVLPRYRYRAVMTNGTVENEMCPVLVAWTSDEPSVDPAEVGSTSWVRWPEVRDDVLSGAREVSPWCLDQVPRLAELGERPTDWPACATSARPAAAQPD